MGRLKERKIIATLAAFAGSGVVIIELAHHILVNHYHFPHQTVDFCIVTLAGALIGTLIWLWFRGAEKRPGNVKVEVLVVPLIILLTLVIDLSLIFTMTGISINMLLIGIVALCLGIAWVIFKLAQWAASVPEVEKKVEALKPTEEKPISFPEWKKSIAVLPFTNMSADPDQEYFCDGMTEEIINALTHIKDLRVIARTSSFAFKGKQEDIREIGKKLNVAILLEGSVRKSGDRLRITAQLIRVADGIHIWSERYDRRMKDIFDIQDEITLAIVDSLKIQLIGSEKKAIVKHYTDNPELYRLYLLGLHHWNKLTPEDFVKSEEYFEQAISKDPNYALAYAGIAEVNVFNTFFMSIAPRDAIQKAKKYLNIALELDENLAEAHAVMGWVHLFYDWDWEKVDHEFKRAFELNPNSAVIQKYCDFLSISGQHERAISLIKRARELDPLSIFINHNVAERILHAGRFDEAIDLLKKTIAMEPHYYYPYLLLGQAYYAKSNIKESIEVEEKAYELSGRISMVGWILACMYYEEGKFQQGDMILDALKEKAKEEYVPASYISCIYLSRGETDEAYKWWKKACDDRDFMLPFYLNWPISFFRIPEEKRFQDLIDKMWARK